jgi:SLOG in TRPM, prokaryote
VEASFEVELGGGRRAQAVRVGSVDDLSGAVRELDVGGRPALVLVGGADGMSPDDLGRISPLFRDVLAPLAQTLGAVVIDGGTDTGVMSLMGIARGEGSWLFPLVGVVVDELASSSAASDTEAELEPNHTHFVLVPGSQWGEEAPWLARLATAVAGADGSATVLVDGGEIAFADVRHSLEAGRHVVVLDNSGRTADALAAAVRGDRTDASVTSLVASGIVHVVDPGDPHELASLLDALFTAAHTG